LSSPFQDDPDSEDENPSSSSSSEDEAAQEDEDSESAESSLHALTCLEGDGDTLRPSFTPEGYDSVLIVDVTVCP